MKRPLLQGRKRHINRKLIGFGVFALLLLCLVFPVYYVRGKIPEKIRILVKETEQFHFNVPMEAEFSQDSVGVLAVNESNVPAGSLHIDLNKTFTIRAEQTGSYQLNIKLFGFLNLKQVTLEVLEQCDVIPCGKSIGILLETRGALVLGTGVVNSEYGNVEPAQNILQTGDYILAVNEERIEGKEELIEKIQNAKGDEVCLTIRREQTELKVKLPRVRTLSGDYKIGVWVRDDTQGIGTLTYVTTHGCFAALGHGISDVDTGILMQADGGNIYDAEIVAVTKGKTGSPGELSGVIRKSQASMLGSVTANTPRGVFGRLEMSGNVIEELKKESKYGVVPLGLRQEVKEGKATVLCQIDRQVEEYEIEILHVDYANSGQSKSIVLKITDPKLLEKTGGIVQGMSGSPILQNGKLIGAVTHVFVNDPTKGYGIFIENMLE